MQTIFKLNTSLESYLTARTALNIASDEMTGDWHFYDYFLHKPNKYFVENINNTPWGSKGVIEVSSILKQYGVSPSSNKIYAANHYRAIADMFLDRIRQKHSFTSLFYSVDDWLNTTKEKQKLHDEYLKILQNKEINKTDLWINDLPKY
ncbi:hypothetical protein [Bathymodiolus septemdierum thioautotrophic gill symbiont]|uniref:Uncharacterized protein n=1 Tax=endosymbiont of Bathymodiolus septemdierum str. Myojin knoll TaxID=1303921 RepID=A0A0P0USZ4_9GAMM|nr:hypothetical protein [Bathymodiolus septemdierum thioautotrophic gill symbiont]BAS68389.1 hypothetical protein BSEPE_1409 [endosymbiont of Bathymodiolus septemdierum str. Myojin knoll]